MSRTASGLRSASATRLAEIAEERPEWRTWIALLEVAWRAIQDDRRPLFLGLTAPPASAEQVPLLHQQTLVLHQLHIQQLLHELLAQLDAEGGQALLPFKLTSTETLDVIAGAVRQDTNALETPAITREI